MKSALITGLLGLGLIAQAQAVEYRYIEGSGIERSLDGGDNWELIRTEANPLWLVWDGEAVCYLSSFIQFGATLHLNCSWNAGGEWFHMRPSDTELIGGYPGYTFEGAFLSMPPYASTLERQSDNTLVLTSYDSVFRLSQGGPNPTSPFSHLNLERVGEVPVPASCEGLPEFQVCASLALEGLAPVWYDPEQPGQGLTIIGRGGSFWGYYTAYDEFGDAHWYLFGFTVEVGEGAPLIATYRADFYEFTGPPLGTPWIPEAVQGMPVGRMYLYFTLPHQLKLEHSLGGESIQLNLVPFE